MRQGRTYVATNMQMKVTSGMCAMFMLGLWAAPVRAQTNEVKAKPPMYTYFANWAIPRARWAEMEKAGAANRKILDQAISSGTLVAYGSDVTLIHQAEGPTHDDWWSSMSMAGLLNVLDDFYKAGTATAPVLGSATMHSDAIYVTRFYNWRAGSWKGAYTHTALYRLKDDAPNDAVEMLSKNFIVPLLEKLLANGTILEYEVDEEAIHTESPNDFWVDFITPNAEGQDKVIAALHEATQSNPMFGPAFGSMVDSAPHRDYLLHSDVVYK